MNEAVPRTRQDLLASLQRASKDQVSPSRALGGHAEAPSRVSDTMLSAARPPRTARAALLDLLRSASTNVPLARLDVESGPSSGDIVDGLSAALPASLAGSLSASAVDAPCERSFVGEPAASHAVVSSHVQIRIHRSYCDHMAPPRRDARTCHRDLLD